MDSYYEPFVGGGSVLSELLLQRNKHLVNHYVCSDLNSGLIDLWNLIKTNPAIIYKHYDMLWLELNKDSDIDRKREYFNYIRDRYNSEHDPADFMFIMRTTTNGMPRYNKHGDFNNSFHLTRNGVAPVTLAKIVSDWHYLLNKYDVQFLCGDYREISPNSDDFVYLDPPYANTKGMYYGAIDYSELWQYLKKLPCKYALSFDGISGETDNTYDVPKDLYSEHIYLKSGNSSFKRVIGKSKDTVVYESLYLKENCGSKCIHIY